MKTRPKIIVILAIKRMQRTDIGRGAQRNDTAGIRGRGTLIRTFGTK